MALQALESETNPLHVNIARVGAILTDAGAALSIGYSGVPVRVRILTLHVCYYKASRVK